MAMADAASRRSVRAATGEGWPARAALVAVGAAFLLLFFAMPLVAVFAEAFGKGYGTYLEALSEPDAQAALRLAVAGIAVPNAGFGVAASWCIAKFAFSARACSSR